MLVVSFKLISKKEDTKEKEWPIYNSYLKSLKYNTRRVIKIDLKRGRYKRKRNGQFKAVTSNL